VQQFHVGRRYSDKRISIYLQKGGRQNSHQSLHRQLSMSNTEHTAPMSDGLLARVAMLESDLATERAALAASRALVEQLTEERDHLRVSHDRLRQELELLRRRIFIAKAERVDRNWNLRRSCPRSTPCQGDLPSSLSRPTSGLARVRTARVIRLLRRSRPGVATCAKPIFLKFASIAYLCQRAAMFCVKDAASADSAQNDIAIPRHHFDAALALLAAARHTVTATTDPPRLLLAG